jgi:hypothetical protein
MAGFNILRRIVLNDGWLITGEAYEFEIADESFRHTA